MQNPPHFLHKQVKNIPIFPFHIRKSHTIYASKSAFQCFTSPQCPRVRWPSGFCWMAIRLTHKWPSVPTPIAIQLPSDGHRTGRGTHLFHSPIRRVLVRGALSACRFSSFQEPHLSFYFITQRLISQKRIKTRVFPSKLFLARKYAILAFGIYSLTF